MGLVQSVVFEDFARLVGVGGGTCSPGGVNGSVPVLKGNLVGCFLSFWFWFRNLPENNGEFCY